MESPLVIVFKFNLNSSGKIMDLQGAVELKHSIPHYTISRIIRMGQVSGPDILPDVDIKCIVEDGKYKWVHTDSGKETYLSKAIGIAIEALPGGPLVAGDTDGEEEEGF